jgi:segregation and condensation protein B
MADINKESIVESLLFISGEPMDFKKLGKLMGENEEAVRGICLKLSDEYRSRNSGIRIMTSEDSVQMVTAKENSEAVDSFLKMDIEGDLSRSALETISIIAYRGPMTRSEIEEIRGVNCSFTLRQLAIRGLVERVDNPSDSRSYLYKVSLDFLRHMGMEKIEDLPRYQELREKELIAERIAKNSEMENAVEDNLAEENK